MDGFFLLVDNDRIPNRLTWIVTMFWSPQTLGFTFQHYIRWNIYGCILHFFLNTPIPLRDHPKSIIWSSFEVISLFWHPGEGNRLVSPCSVFWYRCRISTCPALTTPTADDYDYSSELGGERGKPWGLPLQHLFSGTVSINHRTAQTIVIDKS